MRIYTYSSVSCISGTMRLVGPDGPNMVEGRVEYCSNGLWGTVSDDSFDTRDGEVVCRKLGYQNPSKAMLTFPTLVSHVSLWSSLMPYTGVHLFSSTYYGQGTGPIVFDSLTCDGSESKLEDCGFSSTPYHDSHSEDIGLHCYEQGRMHNISTRCVLEYYATLSYAFYIHWRKLNL